MKTNPSTTNPDPRNFAIVARGTRYSDIQEVDGIEYHIVGYQDLQIWDTKTQSYRPLCPRTPDKFLVSHPDPELAWSEFWFRWHKFVNRIFPTQQFIRIESI